jgi:hypothetical protein
VAVGRVADRPHVDPVAVADVLLDDRRLGRVEVLRRRPAGRVRDVRVGRVRRVAVLVDEVPQVLGRKVEHLRRGAVALADRGRVEVVERRALSLGKVREGDVNHVVARLRGRAGEDVVCAVVLDDRGVLERRDVVAVGLREDERLGRAPLEAGREGRARGQVGDRDVAGR